MSKICIFSAQFLPHMGGVERYTYNLARYLTARGDQVTVITSLSEGLSMYEKMDEIEVYRMPSWQLMDGRYPVLKPCKDLVKIHKRLKKKHFDLIYINTRFYPLSLYGTIFAGIVHKHCVMVEHGTSHLQLGSFAGNLAVHIVEHVMTTLDRINCRNFYGVSEACGEWLKHFHIEAKGTFYNAVDLEKIEEIKSSPCRDFRAEYGISEDAIVICFAGRLLRIKGIIQLTKAVSIIRKKYPDVYLMIAGDGEEEKVLRQSADPGVILLGRLDFEDVVTLMTQSDIFCLPSDSEGFATTVLEACACGCYVVTTEQGGSKEMITGPEYGTIISDNKESTIACALERLIPQKEYRKKAAEDAYERLKNNFTWDIVADKVHKLAETVSEERNIE